MWQAESDFQLEWTHQHTRLPLNKCAFPFQINSVEVVGLIHKFHSKTHFPFANRFGRIWCGLWKERISWLGFWCSVKGLVERRFMRKMERNSRNQLKHYLNIIDISNVSRSLFTFLHSVTVIQQRWHHPTQNHSTDVYGQDTVGNHTSVRNVRKNTRLETFVYLTKRTKLPKWRLNWWIRSITIRIVFNFTLNELQSRMHAWSFKCDWNGNATQSVPIKSTWNFRTERNININFPFRPNVAHWDY